MRTDFLSDVPALRDFQAELSGTPVEALLERASGATAADARRAMRESPLSVEGAATILRAPLGSVLDDLVARAHAVTRRAFGRSVHLYAPCYLSSFCVNTCLYGLRCGLGASRLPGAWHSPDRVIDEVSRLARRGFRHVLLVAGESPAIASRDYLLEITERASALMAEVDLEIGTLEESNYRRLALAGASGIVCHQETYDPMVYARVHTAGPKSRYARRLGTLTSAARAGVHSLGLGVLLGLADPTRDVLALLYHARFLAETFPESRLTVSLPRLRSWASFCGPARPVSDEQLLQLQAVLRLALPKANFAASVREPEWLRHRLVLAGVTQMSASMLAAPDTFVECLHDDGVQEALDRREMSEVKWDLEDLGFDVRWTSRDAA